MSREPFRRVPSYLDREKRPLSLIPDHHLCIAKVGPGTYGFNAGRIWDVDNTWPETVSRAMVLGRKMAKSYRDALAEFFPEAFSNCLIAALATHGKSRKPGESGPRSHAPTAAQLADPS